MERGNKVCEVRSKNEKLELSIFQLGIKLQFSTFSYHSLFRILLKSSLNTRTIYVDIMLEIGNYTNMIETEN